MFTKRWLPGMVLGLLIVLFVLVPGSYASESRASSETWLAEYFNNTTLGGYPMHAREYQAIDFNWDYGSPGPAVGPDNFSARFTRNLLLSGRYRFIVTSDDGVRLWVNNQLLIDKWYEHAVQTFSADVDVVGGAHVKLEYFEAAGLAEVHLSWAPVDGGPAHPQPPGTGGLFTATVNANYLILREGPGLGYRVIGVFGHGQVVTLTHRNQDASWVRVAADNFPPGWVNSAYLSNGHMPFTYLPFYGTGEYAAGVVSKCNWLNIRSGPGVRYPVQTAVPRGTVVTLTSELSPDGKWTKVILPNGREGWGYNRYISAS